MMVTEKYAFTPEDSATLQTIADYNPEECGIAVYDARVMLIYDKDDYPDLTPKMMAYNDQNDPTSNDQLGILFPNPATNEVIYAIVLNENQSGSITIFDLFGHALDAKNLSSSTNEVNFSLHNYKAGIYVYKVMINGVLKSSGRLVVTK